MMNHAAHRLAFVPGDPLIHHAVTTYQNILADYQNGHLDAAHFRVARIQMGIHLQRSPSTRYMVRVKTPYGLLAAEQLRTLAQWASLDLTDLLILRPVRPSNCTTCYPITRRSCWSN